MNDMKRVRFVMSMAHEPLPAAEEEAAARRCVRCDGELPLPFVSMDVYAEAGGIGTQGLCSRECALSHLRLTVARGWEVDLLANVAIYDPDDPRQFIPGLELNLDAALHRLSSVAGVLPPRECRERVEARARAWNLNLTDTANRIAAAIELGLEPEW